MSNIGPNFRPPWQQTQPSGTRPAGESTALPAESGHMQSSQAPANPMPNLSQAALAPLFAFENALAPDQLVQLLRNLLQMPKEIVQLLALLADVDPAMGQALLKTLLAEDATVPLEGLQQFLQTHMDKAQDKLLKLLQSSQMSMTGSGQQMGELMSTLSDLVGKAGKSPIEALHTTISLYLPYYPLHPPQAFSLRFEAPDGQDEAYGGVEEVQLVLFIETLSLGAFKITIMSVDTGKWQAVIEHDPVAEPVLPTIQAQVVGASGDGVAQLMFVPRAASAPLAGQPAHEQSATEANTGKQSVGIHPAGGVSAGLLCLGYLLIRIIFELDKRTDLNQQRAAKI